MAKAPRNSREEMMSDALEHLRSALHLLDAASAPSEIGAKIDLAIHELFLALANLAAPGTVTRVRRNTEPQ